MAHTLISIPPPVVLKYRKCMEILIRVPLNPIKEPPWSNWRPKSLKNAPWMVYILRLIFGVGHNEWLILSDVTGQVTFSASQAVWFRIRVAQKNWNMWFPEANGADSKARIFCFCPPRSKLSILKLTKFQRLIVSTGTRVMRLLQ